MNLGGVRQLVLKIARSFFLAWGPMRLSISLWMLSGPGAFLSFRSSIPQFSSSRVRGFVMTSSAGSFICIFSCLCFRLSSLSFSGSKAMSLTSENFVIKRFAAFFWVRCFWSSSKTMGACLFSSPLSSLVIFHSVVPFLSKSRPFVFSCQLFFVASIVSFFLNYDS